MANRNSDTDRLRALLRQVELPAPPAGFTGEVMNETAGKHEGVQTESHLRQMLQGVNLPEPPSDFTYKVQAAIRDRSAAAYAKPIIAKGAWIAIGLFLLGCIAVSVIYPSYPGPAKAPVYFSWLAQQVVQFTTTFREPILYFEIIVLSSALLLGLEKILRTLHWKHS